MFNLLLSRFWQPSGSQYSGSQLLPEDSGHAHRSIPRKFEKLEAWLLMFCGAYGLLVTVVLLKSAVWPLVVCGLFLSVGIARWYWPVRSKLQWAMDALCAVALVAALFADERTGGGAGPYLFILLLLAIGYPLMMQASHALLFGGLLLAVYFSVGRAQPWAVPPALFVLRGVLIAGLAFLAANFGRVLDQSEEGIEQLRRDPESDAYNLHGLLRYGRKALDRCHAHGQSLCLVLLPMPQEWTNQIAMAHGFLNPHPADMQKLRCKALREMAVSLAAVLPADGIVGRDMYGDWVLILPGHSTAQALTRIEHALGRPVQLLYGQPAHEQFVALVPCAVQCQPNENIQNMYARATDIWSRGLRTGAV